MWGLTNEQRDKLLEQIVLNLLTDDQLDCQLAGFAISIRGILRKGKANEPK